MKYGRRAKINGSVQWVELNDVETKQAIEEAIDFNWLVAEACDKKVKLELGINTPEREATLAVNTELKATLRRNVAELFGAVAIKGYTFIQEALERKIDELKYAAEQGG